MYDITSNNDIERIAEVYCFDNTTNMGYYDSYRNFCKKNMIYFSFVYGSKNFRVHSTPQKVLVSASSSEKIRTLAKEKIGQLEELEAAEAFKLEKRILIEYVGGEEKHFKYKEGFEEIFKLYEAEEKTKFRVLSTPYLIFETNEDAIKAQAIEEISNYIKNKDLKKIFDYISDDCLLDVLEERFDGIREIKKEYKRRVGFLSLNLSRCNLYTMIEGTIDERKNSILEIILDISSKGRREYIVHVDFNERHKIKQIKIRESFGAKRNSKIMIEEDLISIKKTEYNDFK